jgi:TonB family protein
MVVGIVRPRVVIPAGYGRDMTDEEIESAFEHELEHVARRDNLVAAVAEVICATFWFDPLHWIARRRLVELREAACDEGVLARGCAAEPYVAALAKTGRASISPAVACMANVRIRERMETIMTYARIRSQWLPERGIRVAGTSVLFLVALGIALLAPAPSLAVETEGHKLLVFSRAASDGRLLLEGEIRTPDGMLVMNPRTMATAGSPVIVQTISGGREYRLTMTVGADGHGTASLEVLEDGVVIDSLFIAIAPSPRYRPPANRISLHLNGADVRDLARTLGALTGLKVSVAEGLAGKVSVDADDVPWPDAVGQALSSIGGRVLMRGDEVIFAPATEQASRGPASPTPVGFETLRPGMEKPQLIRKVDPVYTPEAKAARIAGIVLVRAEVGTDGLVHGVTVLKDLPFGLGQAAADAVRQWTFVPALVDGKPVPVLFNITVSFHPDDEDVAPPEGARFEQ